MDTVLPASSKAATNTARGHSLPDSDFQHLCSILKVSTGDEKSAISELLSYLGAKAYADIRVLDEKDFTDSKSSLSLVHQRDIMCIAKFLRQGGSLEKVRSMKEIVLAVDSSARPSEPSTSNMPSSSVNERDKKLSSRDVIVTLDVGGHTFKTTRKTLCSVPGTIFDAMFSGRNDGSMTPSLRTEGGAHFIDRDGSHFQHILNFLRVGSVVSLPRDNDDKEKLAQEADFYGLDALVRAIRMPKVDIRQCLPGDVLSMRDEEDMLRKSFMDGTASGLDPHRGLVALLGSGRREDSPPLPFMYEPVQDSGADVLMGSLRTQPPAGTATTVRTLEEFHTNFNREHPNVLHRLSSILQDERIIVAGGSVLQALTTSPDAGIRTAEWWGETRSDIDLFLYCDTREEANRIVQRVWNALALDQEFWGIFRSRGIINMTNWPSTHAPPSAKVQVVLRLYESPAEVLFGFDCDSCCCAYDGTSVWMTPRWMRALRTGVNVLNPLHASPNKCSYELRLAKYASRGFGVLVPGMDEKRIDYRTIYTTDNELGNLNGMARLVHVALEMGRLTRSETTPLHIPQRVKTLRSEVMASYDDAKKLTSGLWGLIADARDYSPDAREDGSLAIVIPSMYHFIGDQAFWSMNTFADLTPASECRDAAWNEIVDAGESHPEGVSRRLLDAWDTEKRSREYLNSQMDPYDLDNIYYSHAYYQSEA